MGFCVPPRPSVRIGFIAATRAGSADPRNVTSFLPGPRGLSRTYRANRTIPFDRLPTSGLRQGRECSVADVAGRRPRPPLFGFSSPSTVPVLAALPSAATPPGFGVCRVWSPVWRLRLRVGPPRSVSSGSIHGVFPLQGFCLRPDRDHLALIACPRAVAVAVRVPVIGSASGPRPGESRHPPPTVTSASGRCPLGVRRLSKVFNQPIFPPERNPHRLRLVGEPTCGLPGSSTDRPRQAPNEEVCRRPS